jgi:uncharacterized glyoxalase superfamily protein PhnB
MELKALTPMLQTDSIDRTRDWYEATLGFRCAAEDSGWCRLVRDGVAIMFMTNDHLGAPHMTGTQYIYVDDVMALFEALKGHCVVEWGPEQMPYGMLEFAIKDPNGYLLSFGQQV